MIALITGASSGIGRDMAVRLSEMGYDLILVARRMERLKELQKSLSTSVECISMDLSIESECYSLHERVGSQMIDVLVNNAGYGIYGGFLETDLKHELNMLDLNIRSVHILTKLFLADFKARDAGYILNVASVAAFLPGPLFSSYYASKAYVLRLTEAIHEELRQAKSRVYIGVLCPGPVRTEFDTVAKIGKGTRGMESPKVAEIAIRKMFRRQMVIVPGLAMKITRLFAKVAPEALLLRASFFAQSRK